MGGTSLERDAGGGNRKQESKERLVAKSQKKES
jgi:hypothetical protein